MSRASFCGRRVLVMLRGEPGRRVFATAPTKRGSTSRLGLLAACAATAATAAAVVYALDRSVVQADAHLSVHPPALPWGWKGLFSSLDHSAVRRGWQVYKNVCSTCHSLQYVTFGSLVNVCLTEQEAREVASEYEVQDGPDEAGEYFMRPAKLSDKVPDPFPNEEAARASNGGAYPVDLTYIVNARHHGPDYIFGLLTGYFAEYMPAGLDVRDDQAFNAYFEGGAISMPEMLQDGGVDYDDGTPAYKSQLAKDVVEFLNWTANQEWDTRKVFAMKTIGIGLMLYFSLYSIYRRKMGTHKKTQFFYYPRAKSS